MDADIDKDDHLLDLDNQFCFALYAASRHVVRAYTMALKPLQLTYPQYLVMLVLWEWARDGEARPTVAALGQRLDLDSGTLSPLLKRLEERAYVVRARAAGDDRQVFVRLTGKGRRLKQRARRVPLGMLEDAPMSFEEILGLRDQLRRLRARAAA